MYWKFAIDFSMHKTGSNPSHNQRKLDTHFYHFTYWPIIDPSYNNLCHSDSVPNALVSEY